MGKEFENEWDIRMGFPDGSLVKNPPAMQEMQSWSLSQEELLEKEMATHSSILAWETPWTGEPGRLQSMGSQKSETTLRLNKIHVCVWLSYFAGHLKPTQHCQSAMLQHQRKSQTPYDVTCMWNLKCDTNEPIYKTDSRTHRTGLLLPRGKGGVGGKDWVGGWD